MFVASNFSKKKVQPNFHSIYPKKCSIFFWGCLLLFGLFKIPDFCHFLALFLVFYAPIFRHIFAAEWAKRDAKMGNIREWPLNWILMNGGEKLECGMEGKKMREFDWNWAELGEKQVKNGKWPKMGEKKVKDE